MPTPSEQRAALLAAKQVHDTDAPAEIIVGRSSLSEKARREIVGYEPQPLPGPPETTYVPPGKVLVEWIGVPSPLANDQILAAVKLGVIPEMYTLKDGKRVNLHRMLQKATRFGSNRWDGMSQRTVGPRDGFNRVIRWGKTPGTYVQELTAKEADHLFSLPCMVEFRYFENGEWYEFERDPILLLPPGIQPKVRKIKIRTGEAEALVGIDTARPGMGYYR